MTKKIFTSKGVWNNGLLIVRVLTSIMLIQHGKELVDSKKMHDLITFLADFKIPSVFAYIAKVTECLGSILLFLGLFTRIIIPPLIIAMSVVIWTMNAGNIFDGDLPFLYILLFLVFFFIGPGKWSLDYVLFDKKSN